MLKIHKCFYWWITARRDICVTYWTTVMIKDLCVCMACDQKLEWLHVFSTVGAASMTQFTFKKLINEGCFFSISSPSIGEVQDSDLKGLVLVSNFMTELISIFISKLIFLHMNFKVRIRSCTTEVMKTTSQIQSSFTRVFFSPPII